MKRIKIENDVTLYTLKKIYKRTYFKEALDNVSEMNQFLENLDNGFITNKALDIIIITIFNEKKNGSFCNSTKGMFETINKCRYIKSKMIELKGEQ